MDHAIPDWKEFEIAVATFIEALGSGAMVTHDVKIPDTHTGHPRQRDVWIEWAIGGLFRVRALVSCKYWHAVLNELDIDHFNGEYQSSGANVGIIYAKNGFNDLAIQKARKLGLHCCRLYRNEPADLPELLKFGLAYLFEPRFALRVDGDWRKFGFSRWADLFVLAHHGRLVIDALEDEVTKYQQTDDLGERWRNSRTGKIITIAVRGHSAPLDVHILLEDRAYVSRIEYTMLEGSYNVTGGQFVGKQMTPWMDLHGETPGPGWEQIAELPEDRPKVGLFCYRSGDARRMLDDFGHQSFPS